MQRLTFTFDNGPWLGATEEILAFLADRAIKATFFVVGERLRDPQARKLTERAKADGHWIGNHTLTHGRPLGVDGGRERVAREIGEAQRLIGELAHPLKLFRPNGGGMLGPHLLSPEALSYLVDARFLLNDHACDPLAGRGDGQALCDRRPNSKRDVSH
jgi:peptidoglycan/xylan/chitin deacetylase (PgdA/CDA1 family)